MISHLADNPLITEVLTPLKIQSGPRGINCNLLLKLLAVNCRAKLLAQFTSYSVNIMNKFSQNNYKGTFRISGRFCVMNVIRPTDSVFIADCILVLKTEITYVPLQGRKLYQLH